jgi:hypothetical protein
VTHLLTASAPTAQIQANPESAFLSPGELTAVCEANPHTIFCASPCF